MSRGVRLARFAALVVWLGVLMLGSMTLRAVLGGRDEMALSDAAFDAGDVPNALEHARRAATLYAPGAPHVSAAYERMFAVARGSEAAGDARLATLAWQAVRSAALETRHVWQAHPAALEQANRNLARLAGESQVAERSGRAGDGFVGATGAALEEERGADRRRALAQLERAEAPRPLWLGMLGAGFLLLLVGLGLLARRGFTPDGRLALGPARLGLTLTLIGAACWTFAVYRG